MNEVPEDSPRRRATLAGFRTRLRVVNAFREWLNTSADGFPEEMLTEPEPMTFMVPEEFIPRVHAFVDTYVPVLPVKSRNGSTRRK